MIKKMMEIAEPPAISCFSYPLWTIWKMTDWVASKGPPRVITSICVNSPNAAMVMVTNTKTAVELARHFTGVDIRVDARDMGARIRITGIGLGNSRSG